MNTGPYGLDPLAVWKHQAQRIRNLERLLQNPDSIALRINKRLVEFARFIVEERFITQGASSSSPWAPLKPATIRERARLGYGPSPILKRSGVLFMAATQGKATVTPNQITLTLRDGGAPVYEGFGPRNRYGLFGRKKINRNAAKQIDANRKAGLSTAFMHSGRISDYVDALNNKRPFYGSPTPAELAPLIKERNGLIAAVVVALANGQSLSTAGI